MNRIHEIIKNNRFEPVVDVRKLIKDIHPDYELYHNDKGGIVVMDGDKLLLKVSVKEVETSWKK